MRYSVNSTVLPTNACDLLEWAAAHIEARGFHDGRDGRRFGSNGTTSALLRPGMLGALDVAGGYGRRSSARTYDYDALYAAQRLALDTLADLAAGGVVMHDPDWTDEYQHRRRVVHDWGMQDGRTGADAVALFREAVGLVEDAAAAATRPGRPPLRLLLPTAGDVLEWAAAHIEDVGHRPGVETHDPAGFAGTAACTMLHALDRALVAAKPNPGDAHDWWDAYRAAGAALEILAEHLAGAPVDALEGESDWDLRARRRAVVLGWGNEPGRSTAEVAAAFRAAADTDDAGSPEEPEESAEPGQATFF
ncbi:DUF6197 family protein [Streptomyces sp. NPDC127172]|uniref:DUF6197 family protein n=1 Tax=Streptomyces sp. NPDC127172 TaxID=3345382 RepID=UPI00363CA1B8